MNRQQKEKTNLILKDVSKRKHSPETQDQKHVYLSWGQYILKDIKQGWKISYGMDWLQKRLYGRTNFRNRMALNVQNIPQNYKLHHNIYEKIGEWNKQPKD